MNKNNVRWLAILIAGVCLAGCVNHNQEKVDDSVCSEEAIGETISIEAPDGNSYVNIQDTCMLRIYYPKYSRIDLICGKMPDKNEDSVIMTCAAAYTAKYLKDFDHMNIRGNHISGGKLYNGSSCNAYRGAFTFYDGDTHFAYDNWNEDYQNAVSKGGCGFAQDMMIHHGGIVNHSRKDDDKDLFRALCMIDGKLAVIDSKEIISFGSFIRNLQNAGATEAIYLDMGGWKHSWYRDGNGKAIEIYPSPTPYGTNWITFYK